MMQARQARFEHGEHGAALRLEMTMDHPATHDLFGNEIDGWYWQLSEEAFEEEVEAFQGVGNWRAAAIAEGLVATTDDVPAQLMAEYQGLWNDVGLLHEANFDSDFSPLIAPYNAMMAEIGPGRFFTRRLECTPWGGQMGKVRIG
jgi:hypothetical protein